MTTWQTPKTSWKKGDYYNNGDYNRLINNLQVLKELALSLYSVERIEFINTPTKGYEGYYNGNDFNYINENIKNVMSNTLTFLTYTIRNFKDDTPFVTPEEINKIENMQLTLYQFLIGQRDSLKRLSFRLGGSRIE